MPSGNLIPLAGGSVLYLGSAVPLETSVGLEALQMPLRDRYLTSDPYQKVSGIDSILTVFSGGLLMQYPGDDSSSTWFPMQTMHMCAAVKAASTQGSTRFVSLDSPQGQASREPPIFAVIMRRAKGVKVLECHVFVCKSSDAAFTYVQACTHAFGHQEGWLNDIPGNDLFRFGASSRIIAADSMTSSMTDGMPRVPLQGFLYSSDQPVQHYNISGREPPVQAPPQPAPVAQVAVAQTPGQYVVMNPPGAPVAQVAQMSIPQGYFADWDRHYGMSYMVIPGSPLDDEKHKKKKKHHKKKSSKEEELYYVRRSRLDQDDAPQDYVPVQQPAEPVTTHHEVHYIPMPQNQSQYPTEVPEPPADPTADPATEYYILRKPKGTDPYGYAPDEQVRHVHGPFHFREGVLEGPDTDVQAVYASGLPQQQQDVYASGPQQGVYERRLPRVDYPVYGDNGGFNNMAYSLGYIP